MLTELKVRSFIENRFPIFGEAPNRISEAIEREGVTREEIFPHQGRFLELLCSMVKPQNILELGTFLGYSTAFLAASAKRYSGHVTTVEISESRSKFAERQLQKFGLADHVRFLVGDDRQVCRDLLSCGAKFDFVFLDSLEENYLEVFRLVEQMMAPGGAIVVDNVLMHTVNGWVNGDNIIEDGDSDKNSVLMALLDYIQTSETLTATILPSGSGLLLVHNADPLP